MCSFYQLSKDQHQSTQDSSKFNKSDFSSNYNTIQVQFISSKAKKRKLILEKRKLRRSKKTSKSLSQDRTFVRTKKKKQQFPVARERESLSYTSRLLLYHWRKLSIRNGCLFRTNLMPGGPLC